MKAPTRACRHCGKTVADTPRGHARAHKCAHNVWCVPPYAARRRGVRGCRVCREGRQLRLFP